MRAAALYIAARYLCASDDSHQGKSQLSGGQKQRVAIVQIMQGLGSFAAKKMDHKNQK